MNTSQLSRAEMIAGGGAIVLLISLFLPWYGVDVESGPIEFSVTATAWEAFGFIDILLFLAAVATAGAIAAKATGRASALPVPPAQVVMIAGVAALVLIIFRLISLPGPDVDVDGVDFGRRYGLFLGLIAAGAIVYGARELTDSGEPYTPPVR